jgi:NADH-quinone oxidoreductase subunit M
MLSFLISLPLFACFVIGLCDRVNHSFIRNFSLFWSLVILNITFLFLFAFDLNTTDFQFLETTSWFDSININFVFGIDGLALCMIQLTALLVPVCVILC